MPIIRNGGVIVSTLSVEERVKAFLVKGLNLPESLEFDQPLLSSGLLDSLNVIKIFMHTEEEFGIMLSALEFSQEKFDTITGIASVIREKMD